MSDPDHTSRGCEFCGDVHDCMPRSRVVRDGFGSEWPTCGRADCGLEVVRPGKVQCWCDDGDTAPPDPVPAPEFGEPQ